MDEQYLKEWDTAVEQAMRGVLMDVLWLKVQSHQNLDFI